MPAVADVRASSPSAPNRAFLPPACNAVRVGCLDRRRRFTYDRIRADSQPEANAWSCCRGSRRPVGRERVHEAALGAVARRPGAAGRGAAQDDQVGVQGLYQQRSRERSTAACRRSRRIEKCRFHRDRGSGRLDRTDGLHRTDWLDGADWLDRAGEPGGTHEPLGADPSRRRQSPGRREGSSVLGRPDEGSQQSARP